MNVLEKNNQRKRELDELINKLEIEITKLNGSLLEEDSKLDLEKQRLENLKALLSQKINYKNKGIQDFIITLFIYNPFTKFAVDFDK